MLIAEGLTDGPHVVTLSSKRAAWILEGVKVFGKRLPGARGWINVYPVSGTTMSETDYINVNLNTSSFCPRLLWRSDIVFNSNGGEAIAEVFVEVLPDNMSKSYRCLSIFKRTMIICLPLDPQAETKRLIQNGYVKEGIAFRLFVPETPGTTIFIAGIIRRKRIIFIIMIRTAAEKNSEDICLKASIGNIATSRMTNTRELYRWFNPKNRSLFLFDRS